MQLADGGVLFLDEVAELPDPIQAMLLRVLEDYKMRPISAARDVALDLRFMFATNVDLEQAVANGKFGRDLFHRMNIMGVKIQPLRERREDIFELASMFMNQFSVDVGRQPLRLDDETLLHLTRHNWRGNVRELRNMIERSVILGAFPPEFQGVVRLMARPRPKVGFGGAAYFDNTRPLQRKSRRNGAALGCVRKKRLIAK